MYILDYLENIPPRRGPEWGSGGVFGLKYHRGVLYYTTAFDARAYFVRRHGARVYGFEKVGPQPVSGGDTYNASDAVDGVIYFGGWVHAPARYALENVGGSERRVIGFENKYSHVHAYYIDDDRVELLWKESIRDPERWAGEVSEIIYDPVNDRLLLARGDGMEGLGVYALPRTGGSAVRLTDKPCLKGAIVRDQACFDIHVFGLAGSAGIQCIDLVTGDIAVYKTPRSGNGVIDGGEVEAPLAGAAASAYGRLFLFTRGGLYVFTPGFESPVFIRLFDFVLSGYGPLRTRAVSVGGGILVAFNAFTHAVLRPSNPNERRAMRGLNTIVGPSALVYIAPPMARVVGVFGARITSIEKVGSKIVLGTNTDANYMWYDATPHDTGYRGFIVLDDTVLTNPPPPAVFSVYGWMIGGRHWGGIPLYGYREPRLVVNASKDNTLYVHEYSLALPPVEPVVERINVRRGRNVIDLSGWRGSIVSFRLEEEDPGLSGRIVLE